MISFDEAIELVRSIATPLGTEMVPLARAAGRVLARPPVAQIDSPRSDVSSMDGYAVRDADLVDFPISLHVEGQSVPGAAWSDPVSPGSCVRIFTGAPVPAAADRVVIQEDVRRDGPLVIIDREPEGGRNIRRRGSDFRCGEELLAAAQFLGPRALVAAAAADTAQLEVCRRPRLCILSTGDELAEPGSARQHPDAIPDSVSLGVAALAEQWGGECIGRNGLRDDLASMQKAAEAAIDATDLVVVTGGASVGERDFAKAMFDPVGLELLFSKVSMKPGKPAWLGRVREKIVIGLPGNPTSAMVTARLLLAPLLAGMTGLPLERALHWRKVQLSSSVEQCGARETFHRARSVDGKAEILPFQDSGAQKTLAEANLLVRQAANSPALDSGAEIDALDF